MIASPDLLLYFFVGAVVSLDVAALTCVKKETYLQPFGWSARWAMKNAFWHAILLLAYSLFSMAVIDWIVPSLLQTLIAWLLEINAPSIVVVVFGEFINHLPFIVGLFVMWLVWGTYRSKICDNPLRGNTEIVRQFWLPVKVLHWFFPENFVKEQAQAMMVAADMLALAFLLKSLGKLGDVETLGLTTALLKVTMISGVIFVSVFLICLTISAFCRRGFADILKETCSKRASKANLSQVLFLLRLLEPFMIFYFLMELMSFVVWERLGSSSLFFIGSAFLVFALVRSVRLEEIIKSVSEMTDDLITPNTSGV